MKQYIIDSYRAGCEEKIAELFQEVFKREFAYDDWNWRFRKNPCEQLCITTLWDDNKLIAHNALTPSYAYRYGKRIVSANSGTTMAKPEYMGVSIQLFNDCQTMYSDIQLIFGFPNKNSYRITTKYIHHRYIGDMCFWTKETQANSEGDYDIHRISSFTAEHGELYKHLIDETAYITEKSQIYLNWRFVAKPNSGYRCFELIRGKILSGYIVLNAYQDGDRLQGQIIDLIALRDTDYERLIRFAENHFFTEGCTIIKAWASHRHLGNILSGMGFEYGLHPFPMTIWNEEIPMDQMYITMADSDVF